MSNTPRPTSSRCTRGRHSDCSGYASTSKNYGNTPCWCPCHDSEPAAAAPCSHDLTGDELQGMAVSGDSHPCPRCGVEVIRW